LYRINATGGPNTLVADPHDLIRTKIIFGIRKPLWPADYHGNFLVAKMEISGCDLYSNVLQFHPFISRDTLGNNLLMEQRSVRKLAVSLVPQLVEPLVAIPALWETLELLAALEPAWALSKQPVVVSAA
jgi:hypothetical protein